ncbi:hypothetical protein LTR35_016528 [Friedmanniomyces endolithicus]|nr:hypothetical protein LTR35_016528 [Friedmanniomyces endolithicus]KAK0273800.1 hypothetical protein LTS00_015650 [Friedmanniomyces endolithicus]
MTVSAALARCDTLPAVRELSSDDRIRLLIIVAQPPLPEILAALSDRDLVPYVETLMVRAQQPRSEALPPSAPTGGSKTRMSSAGYGAVTRCANLPAFRALPRADHCLLFPAVARPPHAATVVALSDADLVGYVKALVVSLKQAGAARSSTIAGPLGMLTGDSAATAAAEAVPAAAVVPRLPYQQQQQQQQSQPRPNAVYADLQRLEEYTGVGAAALLGASAMAQGERTSLSLLGESWTGQSWARKMTEYLWGHFHRDMGSGTVGDGGSSAPAVEAGAVSSYIRSGELALFNLIDGLQSESKQRSERASQVMLEPILRCILGAEPFLGYLDTRARAAGISSSYFKKAKVNPQTPSLPSKAKRNVLAMP